MAAVVPVIFNAALSGMLAGLQSGRSATDATAGDYAAQVNAATTFATALDIAVGADASLAAAGATVVPAAAAGENAMVTRPTLMFSLCKAYFETKGITGVPATDTAAGTYTTAINAIKAQYTQALTAMSAA